MTTCWCQVAHEADHLVGPTWYESSDIVLTASSVSAIVPAGQVETDSYGHRWLPWMREKCAMHWLCVDCKAWRYAHICGAPDPVGGPWYYLPGTNPSWDEAEGEGFMCSGRADVETAIEGALAPE